MMAVQVEEVLLHVCRELSLLQSSNTGELLHVLRNSELKLCD